MNEPDYLQIYDLETYLLETARRRFHAQGYLTAFDFFCIIIWKANRAKSNIARRLLAQSNADSLENAVFELTNGIYQQPTGKDRLRYLFETWKIWLPIASAILTILYPDEFTIYDYRVCDLLGDFHKLYNLGNFEKLWTGYQRFKKAVISETPENISLRDRDRYLWGKSFEQQLVTDIANKFFKAEKEET